MYKRQGHKSRDAVSDTDSGRQVQRYIRLKKLFQNQQLTSLDIQQILSEEKPNQQEVMKISAERLQAVLPQGLNAAETEDYVIKVCEHYRLSLIHILFEPSALSSSGQTLLVSVSVLDR